MFVCSKTIFRRKKKCAREKQRKWKVPSMTCPHYFKRIQFSTNYLPRDNGNLSSIVRVLQQSIQISHDLLKRITHEIQGSIGKDYRIFLVATKVFLGHDIKQNLFVIIFGNTRGVEGSRSIISISGGSIGSRSNHCQCIWNQGGRG